MQIHVPDPRATRPERARANFRLAIRIAVGLAAVPWLVQFVNSVLALDPGDLGVRPRTLAGLAGILSAPLAHGDFGHLIANTPAIAVLITLMLTLYPRSTLRVLPAVYLLPGIAVWLFADAGTSHLGASGIVYGLAAYLFAAGLIRRDRRAVAASMLVSFLYGALVWGLVPIRPRLSWETHLAAAIVGVAMALALRHLDPVAMRRYDWEDEPEIEPGEEAGEAEPNASAGEREAVSPRSSDLRDGSA